MGQKTNISWCDSTLNFWSGCTKVSPGCAHCYAETLSNNKFFGGGNTIGKWGKGAERKLHESAFTQAIRLNKRAFICDECGYAHFKNDTNVCNNVIVEPDNETTRNCQCRTKHRRRIFSLSLGDWLDDEVPIEWLARMLDTIRQCQNVIWILCTKRTENFRSRLEDAHDSIKNNNELESFIYDWLKGKAPSNVILLASVENQEAADKRIPALLKIAAACRGLSLEPLLGEVNLGEVFAEETPRGFQILSRYYKGNKFDETGSQPEIKIRLKENPGIHWLIIGGESGTDARPCNVEWIRSLVAQGKAAGVPTFVKQLGAFPQVDHEMPKDGNTPIGEYHFLKFKDKKGGDISEWPKDLQIQQFPQLKVDRETISN